MAETNGSKSLLDALHDRFGEQFALEPSFAQMGELATIAAQRTHRHYLARPVAPDLLRILCACALSAPSKSDLQQSDIVVVTEPATREAIAAAIPDMPWVGLAPAFLVFIANGGRLPLMAQMRKKPFPNDHLDLFFNAVVDTGIVLATFLRSAAAVGLGCCPISAIRDHAPLVNELLRMPQRALPVAGLCVGWPAVQGHITPRLGLATTLHQDCYEERDLERDIDEYDRRRAGVRPYAQQRHTERWGAAGFYGWSEDKARQYAEPLRADFGAFVRAKGFRLE
ncbi:MAG: nitroreductase family protein [Xanthobacteraceae bacterium]